MDKEDRWIAVYADLEGRLTVVANGAERDVVLGVAQGKAADLEEVIVYEAVAAFARPVVPVQMTDLRKGVGR